MRRQSGFTLIEVLVVLLIISIVTSVALLTIRRNENKEMESLAHEITQILSLAEEQALLQPTVLGVSMTEQQMTFASLENSGNGKKPTWAPFNDAVLGTHRIPKDIQISLQVDKASSNVDHGKAMPQIIISSNGDVTPFAIYIGKKGKKPRYVIKGNADGTVTNQFLS